MSVEKWDQRQLCSDGSCIGVIGPEGTCKMCGRAAPNWGEERTRGLAEDTDDTEAEPPDDAAEAAASSSAVVRAAAVVALKPRGEWNERRLCSDGACIGVIGDTGTCKLCGKAAPNDAFDDDDHDDDDDFDDDDPDDQDDAAAEADDEEAYDDAQDDELAGDDDENEDEDEDEDEDAVTKDAPAAAAGATPAGGEREQPGAKPSSLEEDLAAPRALCSDGACVGVIGPAGTCKVCGKAAT